MASQKTFTTFSEQIDLLKNEKHLVISNTFFRLSVIYVLSCPIIFQKNMAKRRRLIWIGTITTTTAKIRKLLYA